MIISYCKNAFPSLSINRQTLARSFTVSVLPVPAGPAGLPPRFKWQAPVKVRLQRSVKGVMTSLFKWQELARSMREDSIVNGKIR